MSFFIDRKPSTKNLDESVRELKEVMDCGEDDVEKIKKKLESEEFEQQEKLIEVESEKE